MNTTLLVLSYLKSKPLNTILNVLLLAVGISLITILMLFGRQLRDKIVNNSSGIDLVVGAKGSPMQLILCNIFHIDFPTGNIKLSDAEKMSRHRLVKKAIPIALGDSYEEFRIVGTNRDYLAVYHARLNQGKWWDQDFEATVGSHVAAALKLNIGSTFSSAHGLDDGGHVHDNSHYTVVGIMEETGNVVDNLILASVESVWKVHDHEGHYGEEEMDHSDEEEDHDVEKADHHDKAPSDELHDNLEKLKDPSRLVPTVEAADTTLEITSVLIQYRNPLGAVQLPRYVNDQSSMQAASPAFEISRLFSILGVGIDVVKGIATVLIFTSALSIFIALLNSLRERQYDLAVMRSMGCSRKKLVTTVLLESTMITTTGSMLGIVLGHISVLTLSSLVDHNRYSGITTWILYQEHALILVGAIILGIVCALIPAANAYRVNIHNVLANN